MCLKDLEMLTNQLISIGVGKFNITNEERIDFELKQGNSYAINVLTTDDIHVSRMFMSKDTVFPYHQHNDADEIIVLVEGSLSFISEDKALRLIKGDAVKIDRHSPHLLMTKEDCWMIIITIPATKEAKEAFKDGRK